MQTNTNQPQTGNSEYGGYGPQPYPASQNAQEEIPQGGYSYQPGPNEYPPSQPYPPSDGGQQWQQQMFQQPYSTSPGFEISPFERTSMGMKARTAGLLCYLFSWVGGLVFLLLERDNRFVRFHAMQSILFFGTLSILEWVCSFIPFVFLGISGALGLVGFIGWIVLMVNAHRGKYFKLPFFGDIAEKYAMQFRI